MKLYISGPMRGLPAFNFPAFQDAEGQLNELGHETFSPARRDLDEGFDPSSLCGFEDLSEFGFSLRRALAADCAAICEWADGVIVLEGWQHSKGAQAEVALARALGLPVVQLLYVGPDQPRLVEVPTHQGARP